MKRLMNFKWSILLMTIFAVATLYFYSILPAEAQIPTHWNIHNEIDGWMSKDGHLLYGIGMLLGLWALVFFMPYYSPWYKSYEDRNEKMMPGFAFILVLFFGLINLYSQYIALRGGETGQVKFILTLIGLLFIFLGNVMPKIPKNFFMGIKTPWTLSNEEVWHRTHRLGGLLFFISGVLMVIKSLISSEYGLFNTISSFAVLALVLFPLPYSFYLYKKLGKG